MRKVTFSCDGCDKEMKAVGDEYPTDKLTSVELAITGLRDNPSKVVADLCEHCVAVAVGQMSPCSWPRAVNQRVAS